MFNIRADITLVCWAHAQQQLPVIAALEFHTPAAKMLELLGRQQAVLTSCYLQQILLQIAQLFPAVSKLWQIGCK